MLSKKSAVFVLTIVLVVCCDRVTKILASEFVAPGFHYRVFPFFDIVHYTNSGIAFGMLQNLGDSARFALHGGSFAAALVFAALLLRRSAQGVVFVAFILGGAIGNSIDRLAFGYVTDFMELHWFGSETLRWPAFNAADFFITVGAVSLAAKLFRQRGAEDVYRDS